MLRGPHRTVHLPPSAENLEETTESLYTKCINSRSVVLSKSSAREQMTNDIAHEPARGVTQYNNIEVDMHYNMDIEM